MFFNVLNKTIQYLKVKTYLYVVIDVLSITTTLCLLPIDLKYRKE